MAERYQQVTRSRKDIFVNNLIGGIAWGLGATLGIGVLLALLGIIAKQVGVIPVIGTFVSDILDFVLKHNPHLQK